MASDWMNWSSICLDLFVLLVMPYISKIFQSVSTQIILLDVTLRELSFLSCTFMNGPESIKISNRFKAENSTRRSNDIGTWLDHPPGLLESTSGVSQWQSGSHIWPVDRTVNKVLSDRSRAQSVHNVCGCLLIATAELSGCERWSGP